MPVVVWITGECIVANLDDMKKDVCAKEFSALKQCFRKVMRAQRAKR